MKFTLDVTMANTEGALERLLGRLRQRSFTVCALNAGTSQNFARMDVRITVESARAIELAIKQLNKLIDVDGVEITKAEEHHHQHEAKRAQHAAQQHQHLSHSYERHGHVSPFEHLQTFELNTSHIGL